MESTGQPRQRSWVPVPFQMDSHSPRTPPRKKDFTWCQAQTALDSLPPPQRARGVVSILLLSYFPRSFQSRGDSYRMFIYDVAVAAHQSNHSVPDLFTRHNAVPGMFLVSGAKVVMSAQHIRRQRCLRSPDDAASSTSHFCWA